MGKLSDLRVTVHSSFAVNADGTEGELKEQSEPRYSDVKRGISFSSAEEALASVDAEDDIEEGEVVEEVHHEEAVAEEPAEPEAFEEVSKDEGEVGEQISE